MDGISPHLSSDVTFHRTRAIKWTRGLRRGSRERRVLARRRSVSSPVPADEWRQRARREAGASARNANVLIGCRSTLARERVSLILPRSTEPSPIRLPLSRLLLCCRLAVAESVSSDAEGRYRYRRSWGINRAAAEEDSRRNVTLESGIIELALGFVDVLDEACWRYVCYPRR